MQDRRHVAGTGETQVRCTLGDIVALTEYRTRTKTVLGGYLSNSFQVQSDNLKPSLQVHATLMGRIAMARRVFCEHANAEVERNWLADPVVFMGKGFCLRTQYKRGKTLRFTTSDSE